MPSYTTEKKETVNTVGQLLNALRDVPPDQPITGPLGGLVMLRWLKDEDTEEVIIEFDEDDGWDE